MTINNKTDYSTLIPDGVLFNLKEIQEMKLLKMRTAREFIKNGMIETVRIGNKIHISRAELIRYLEEQTVPKTA